MPSGKANEDNRIRPNVGNPSSASSKSQLVRSKLQQFQFNKSPRLSHSSLSNQAIESHSDKTGERKKPDSADKNDRPLDNATASEEEEEVMIVRRPKGNKHKSSSGLRTAISESDSNVDEDDRNFDQGSSGLLTNGRRTDDSDSDTGQIDSGSDQTGATTKIAEPANGSASLAVEPESDIEEASEDPPFHLTSAKSKLTARIVDSDSDTDVYSDVESNKKFPPNESDDDSDASDKDGSVSSNLKRRVGVASATQRKVSPSTSRDSSDSNTDCDESTKVPVPSVASKKRAVTALDSSSSSETEIEEGGQSGHCNGGAFNMEKSNDADGSSSSRDTDSKENRLNVLCHVFPGYDQMEHQDLLVKNSWNLKTSMDQLRQKEAAKRCSATTVKRRRIQVAVDSSDDDSDCTSRWKGHAISGTVAKAAATVPTTSTKASTSRRKAATQGTASDDSDRERSGKRGGGIGKKSGGKHSKRGEGHDDEEEEAYDSDAGLLYDSEDSDVDDRPTHSRTIVINFYNGATLDELIGVPGCTRKKADTIVELRPYTGWLNLISKFKSGRSLSTDLINGARDILKSRRVVTKLMKRCEGIADRMGARVARLLSGDSSEASLKEQPGILADGFTLAPYQLLGINWLVLMHGERVNGILADEMGLGKTIQTISFLASRWEEGDRGPHLVVAPASTIDNWEREFSTWCPAFRIILYQGSQEERRMMRMQILSGQERSFNVMLATYNMITGMPDDRQLFRKVKFHYVVFDEAHLLKNMATLRYQHLIKIRADRRLLLTGTPLQNNLVELMSLLVFVMPSMFDGKVDHLKAMFAIISKDTSDDMKGSYEKDRIEHAKRIMKPFVLRRLKSEVLQQLPKKKETLIRCPMTDSQRHKYELLIASFSKQLREHKENLHPGTSNSGSGMMMQLRRLANHPLLLRYHYDDKKLKKMAELMLKEPTHENANEQFVFEDMQVMSDFELNRLCGQYKGLSRYILDKKYILSSGKFEEMSRLLPKMKQRGDRVLLFSQFVIVLDIVESYMKLCSHKYLRLDGSTPIHDRQIMIDQFTKDNSIFLFMLSTKAGGLGINLTAANTVILHDIDFNPYNDKQAEDRCHRVGQTKDVKVIRLISKDTIEEGIYQAAEQKLKLERDVTGTDKEESSEDAINVASLLKVALGV